HPAQGRRLPIRQDLRQLASSGLLNPPSHTASIDDVGVDRPGRELGRLWAQRERGILRLLLISVRQTVQSAPSPTRFLGPSPSPRSPAPTAAYPIGPNAGLSA